MPLIKFSVSISQQSKSIYSLLIEAVHFQQVVVLFAQQVC